MDQKKIDPNAPLQKQKVYTGLARVPKKDIAQSARETRVSASDEAVYSRSKIEQVIQRKKSELPHLYGFPWYSWAREFFESRSKLNFLTGGNQSSKSSSAIRKCIEWAGNKSLWPELWPGTVPRIFWYMYPSADLATAEVEKKWIPEFMPRGSAKNDGNYGWTLEYKKGYVHAIHFNSGITVYFKFYTQKARNLQATTLNAVFVDEELPPEFYDEISARLSAGTGGYYHQVFTATDGHLLWYKTMERIGQDDEAFPNAHKQIVSLYDCLTYEDGTPGGWSIERIKQRESECSSDAEILRRVMGRFVKEEGRKYSQFDPGKHHKKAYPVPVDYKVYAAVDIGSGRKSHSNTTKSSGAIVFIAVNPELTRGTIFKMWRGDDVETSAGDILDQYRKMRAGIAVVQAAYDHGSKEFGIIASRSSENFVRADKSRDAGAQTLNTLFKHCMLDIMDVDDSAKMVSELMTVPAGVKTRTVQDDLSDTLRYCVLLIPWDWSRIKLTTNETLSNTNIIEDRPLTDEEQLAAQIKARRGEFDKTENPGWEDFDEELEYWNEQYG